MALSTINALRFALQANNSFHDADVDHDQHFLNLARISFTLGVMFSWACIIEIYGVFSSLFPRPCLIHAYTLFALLSVLVVTAAGMISTIGYFMFADDLVAECVTLASTGRMDMRSLFRSDAWRTSYGIPIPAGNAQTQCLETFHSESTTQILSVLLFSLVPSTICFLVVWTWSRQVRDPGHVAYLGESRFCGLGRGVYCFGGGQRHSGRSAIRMEEYSPLYNSYTPQPTTAHSHHATTRESGRTTNRSKGKAPAKSNKGNTKSFTKALNPKGMKASSSSRSKSKRASGLTDSMSTLSTKTRSTRGSPPEALPVVSEMTQMHHNASVTENFHTMSPFALSPSPYGISPGPPSFAGGYEGTHTYDYPGAGYDYSEAYGYHAHHDGHPAYVAEGDYDVWSRREGDIALQAAQPQMQNVHETQSSQAGAQHGQLPQAPVRTRGRGEYWFV